MTSSGLGLEKVINLFSDNKKVSNDKTVSNDNVKLGASAACVQKCNNECTPSSFWDKIGGIFTGGTIRKTACFSGCIKSC